MNEVLNQENKDGNQNPDVLDTNKICGGPMLFDIQNMPVDFLTSEDNIAKSCRPGIENFQMSTGKQAVHNIEAISRPELPTQGIYENLEVVNVYIGNEGPEEETDKINLSEIDQSMKEQQKSEPEINLQENVEIDSQNPPKKKTKKRLRKPMEWKQNDRKIKRQKGEQYIDRKGKEHSARKIYGNCRPSCTYQCKNITPEERQIIFDQFWKLSDIEKGHYYARFVKRNMVARRRVKDENNAKKNWTYSYNFEVNNNSYKVCKEYFLSTLNISAKRIYYFFKRVQNPVTSIPRTPNKGNMGKKAIPHEQKDLVRKHINSFECLDSHYCRANTNKKYLDASLNISRMYDLYTAWLPEGTDPVKKSMYCNIFNTEFNLAFHVPKKDLCDKCEEFKKVQEPDDETRKRQEDHVKHKEAGRKERQRDRENKEDSIAVVTFDLENVFALPKINVSNAFYKKKLNCYNLTGHCSTNNITYCSIWHEYLSGRAGNHLASALIKILKNVVKDNENLRKIILWSDSCVPQNKNSIMSVALQTFLQSEDSKNVIEIEQKFCEPGHSNLQEIDAVHSVIERFLRPKEIMSPVSLCRFLTQLPSTYKTKLRVLQMKLEDFKDYQTVALCYVYNKVPYNKVKQISYNKFNQFRVSFRKSFDDELQDEDICQYKSKKADQNKPSEVNKFPPPKPISTVSAGLRKDKRDHLISMLKYMDGVDLQYFKHLLRNTDNTEDQPGPSRDISKEDEKSSETKTGNIKPTLKEKPGRQLRSNSKFDLRLKSKPNSQSKSKPKPQPKSKPKPQPKSKSKSQPKPKTKSQQ